MNLLAVSPILNPQGTPEIFTKVHPVAEGALESINYSARINGTPVDVHCFSGFAGGDISWLSFDFIGETTVSVVAKRNVEKVEVSPKSAGIVAELNGNTATVRIKQPCKLLLKWDDGFELPFHIFANGIETDIPEPNARNIRYFGPGNHWPGVIQLSDNETVYIAGGATVFGVIQANEAKNISIRGRGILCASHLDRKTKETYCVDGTPNEVLGLRNCQDVQIDGITILDSHHWTVALWNSDRVRISNLKIFNERNFSTDGVVLVNCRDVVIEDCFFRCKDDCITIKGLDERYPADAAPILNILVQGCVFWSDNNNGVVVGSETKARVIKDITFRDIDFVRVANTCGDYAGAFSIICLHDTCISDIRFEDLRIEHCTGPYFNFFFCDSIFRIPGVRQEAGGVIKDVLVRNVRVTGGPVRSAYITGYDEHRRIENVRIENFSIHGKLVHSAEQGRIRANRHTAGVTIQADAD